MKLLFLLITGMVVSSLSASASVSIDMKPFDYASYGGARYCLKSDFDGNGISDYVAPLGEGWIHVFMNYGSKTEKRIDIDAGGAGELYAPRKKIGDHGEPCAKNPSIIVRWVGKNHVVFRWTGNEFEKMMFPAFYEAHDQITESKVSQPLYQVTI